MEKREGILPRCRAVPLLTHALMRLVENKLSNRKGMLSSIPCRVVSLLTYALMRLVDNKLSNKKGMVSSLSCCAPAYACPHATSRQ
jgi:hypothetical protein